MNVRQEEVRNRILASLPADEFAEIAPLLEPVGLVTHVTDVNAAEMAGYAGQRNHFLGSRWFAYLVLQTGRQTERAVAHGLFNQLLHLFDLFRRGVTICVLAHYL